MLEFLQTYWKLIALVVLLLFDLVLVILNRRKPVKVYDAVHQVITAILPGLINSAEASYLSGHGDDKKKMVMQLVFNYLSSVYGMNEKELLSYESYISKQIEEILSTPHAKKGGSNEK